MTLDGDGHGQARDVAGIRQAVNAECRGVAAVALGADTEPVGAAENFLLELVNGRVRVGRPELATERLLREQGRPLEGTAHADAGNERRTGIGARRPDALEDPVLAALDALGGGEPPVRRAVLAAPA